MSTTAIAIKQNLRDLIAQMDPPVVPLTTLAANASIGDTTLTIVPCLDAHGRSRFLPGGRASFYDGIAEQNLPILSITPDGATITLDTAGMLTPGLLADHASGTTLYTNLTAYAPRSAEAMLARGDPVIYVVCEQRRARRHGQHLGFPTYRVCLRYLRRVDRPANSAIDADVWGQEQEDAMLADMERIELLLLANQELITDFSPAVAMQFQAIPPYGGTDDLISTTWTWQPAKDGTWVLLGQSELHIAGVAVPLAG